MKKIIVLGAGMVGKAIAIDLAARHQVTSADISPANLEKLKECNTSIKTVQADLSNKALVSELIKDQDLVIGAVPGFMGYETVENVIKAGKDIIDISFFPEDAFGLDRLATEKSVTAIIDCGVAPGMHNIILGDHSRSMQINSFECLVGGLPVERSWPYQYKAPFSPIDVLEEYTRPSRIVVDGKSVEKEALTDAELIHFEGIGTLEAFNTDGLRTLIRTMNIPDMIEKTLRYPGHIELMKVFRESGFFSKDHVSVNGQLVRPIDLTSALLFPDWKYKEGEEEFTVMRVTMKGIRNGKNTRITYNLYDRYDKSSMTSSMARTTGYTCTAVAELVLNGVYKRKGISPPEYIGFEKGCLQKIFDYQAERGIVYTHSELNE